MAPGSTQPLTKMSTRNLKKETWELRHLVTLGASTACNRDIFTFTVLLLSNVYVIVRMALKATKLWVHNG
jgi:hypothetical protein